MQTHINAVVAAVALSLLPAPAAIMADSGTGTHSPKDAESSMSIMRDDKQDKELRGQPGVNTGAQNIPPDEGEQTGKPGTMFGAPATLPPQDRAPGYEGADKEMKQKESR